MGDTEIEEVRNNTWTVDTEIQRHDEFLFFSPFGPVRCFSFTMHKTTDSEYKVKAIRSLWYARTQCACGHPCCTVRFKLIHHAKFHKALQQTCFVINAHHKLTTKTNWSRSWKYLILVDKESQQICKIYERYSYTYVWPVFMNLWGVNGVTSSLQGQRKRNIGNLQQSISVTYTNT